MNRPDPNDPYAHYDRYDRYGRKLAPGWAGWAGRLASEEAVVPQKRSDYAAWRRSQRRHRLGNAVLLLMFPPAAILYLLATRDPGAGVTLVFRRFDKFEGWIVTGDYPPLGPLKLDWLLGFRTGVVWKRVVSSPVYAFIGFALVVDIVTWSLVGLAFYLAMLLVIVLIGLYLPESGGGNARLQLWSYSDPRDVKLKDGKSFRDAQGRDVRIFLA